MDADELSTVASLLRERNVVDAQLASIVARPPSTGHLGEWIAARVFDIQLEKLANAAAIDGTFSSGPLTGKTVNVKWYSKRSNILDLSASAQPDYYLVFTGPAVRAATSAGQVAPARIDAVYLFDGPLVVADLRSRGRHVGTASSVLGALWAAAEIYPNSSNPTYVVSADQASALQHFSQ